MSSPAASPGDLPVSVLDAALLKASIVVLRDSREEEVIALLQEAHDDGVRMPPFVTLRIGQFTAQILPGDLLLCTSPGRFPPHSLAANSTITIPEDLLSAVGVQEEVRDAAEAAEEDSLKEALTAKDDSLKEALTVVAGLIKDRRHACSEAALAYVVRASNYIGAEGILNGKALKLHKAPISNKLQAVLEVDYTCAQHVAQDVSVRVPLHWSSDLGHTEYCATYCAQKHLTSTSGMDILRCSKNIRCAYQHSA
jgi:hypothetical protein